MDVVMGEEAVLEDTLERQLLDRMHDVLDGMASDTVPAWVTPLIGEAAVEMLEALTRTADECEIRSKRWRQPVRFHPARASRSVWARTGDPSPTHKGREVSGMLEAVDLKPPGRFRLRDDVGNAIPLERVTNVEEASGLVGTRVTAVGDASLGPQGRVLRVTDAQVSAVQMPDWALAPHAGTAVLAASTPPIGGVEGVTGEEVDDFLALIRG